MDNAPSVSVVVTVYNRDKYLAACLDSILASSWTDLEVVIVDDGSTDESVSIAGRYAALDQRVRFSRNNANLGDYPNRTHAAGLARGRYLKYLDSDDLIYRHSLSIMVEAMEANPSVALGLSHSSPATRAPYPWVLSPAEAWRKEFLGGGCLDCGPSGAIIRRKAFVNSGGFRDWGVVSDIDLWYRMSATWPVLLMPQDLVFWRRHDDQEFTKSDAENVYLERGFDLTMTALRGVECPLDDGDRLHALRRARQHHARRLISVALRQRRPGRAIRMLRRSGLSSRELIQGFRNYL